MSAQETVRTSLDGHGIFAIIVFAIVSLICIQPLQVPLPFFFSKAASHVYTRLFESPLADGKVVQLSPPIRYIILNHVWTPAIGIIFLLTTKTIGGEQIKLGIVGEEGVKPYDVLALFISLAYIAISLDATGLLRYLAFQVCQKAGSSGYTLYIVLYGFFWIMGVVVGNDPVILSGTAFLVHLTRVAGISPSSAWIWAQFVAANISSAVLVSSNPTNLVIASGFNVSFPVYTAYMILPSFVSALVSLGVLLLFFRNKTTPRHVKHSRGRSSLEIVQGWTKGIKLAQPVLQSRKSQHNGLRTENREATEMSVMPSNDQQQQMPTPREEEDNQRAPLIYIPQSIVRPDVDARAALVDPKGAIFNSVVMLATLIILVITSVFGHVQVYLVAAPGAGICLLRDIVYDWYTWRSTRKERTSKKDSERTPGEEQPKPEQEAADQPLLGTLVSTICHLNRVFPTVTYVFTRLPFPLLPFAFGMFILVQTLSHVGFINIMAGGLGQVCSSGPAGCAIFLSTLGVILCNVSKFLL